MTKITYPWIISVAVLSLVPLLECEKIFQFGAYLLRMTLLLLGWIEEERWFVFPIVMQLSCRKRTNYKSKTHAILYSLAEKEILLLRPSSAAAVCDVPMLSEPASRVTQYHQDRKNRLFCIFFQSRHHFRAFAQIEINQRFENPQKRKSKNSGFLASDNISK